MHSFTIQDGLNTYLLQTINRNAFEYLSRTEGIIPAIESAHAVAHAMKLAPLLKDQIIVVNLSGRGDKDVASIARYKGVSVYE